MIRTVGVIPPDVVANPVYDVDTGAFSASPLSLLLPGEVVRWGGKFYHACPRCWGVFSLSEHDANVNDVGTISVEPTIVCPSCGLNCEYEEGRIDTEGLEDDDPENEDWQETREQRAEFIHEYRPNDVERLLSLNYGNVRDAIRSDDD